MQIEIGSAMLDYPGSDLGELRDSNDLLGDIAALRARMAEDGYLLLRGLIDRDAVKAARAHVLDYMDQQSVLVPGEPVLEGVMANGAKNVPTLSAQKQWTEPAVRGALEHPALFDFWARWFGEPALTYRYKWLRAVGNKRCTGAHYDVVYMGRGSRRLHTCWIPLGDINIAQGTLAVCVGSHNLPGFEKLRQTYGHMDVDRDRVDGWFTDDPLEITRKFGGQWCTADFAMGDVLMFGLYTMHMSTTNTTNRYRLSCDVRFQPQSEPVDDRWAGDEPKAHDGWHAGPTVSMADARAAWGV